MKHFQSQLTHNFKRSFGGPQQEDMALEIIIIIDIVKLHTF